MKGEFRNRLFGINTEVEFLTLALELFNYQYHNNSIYNRFVDYLGIIPREVDSIEKIPFLPIDFFKTQRVITGSDRVEKVFESSGTTNAEVRSNHYVTDLSLYEESLARSFRCFYGNPADYRFFSLLPSYVERQNSSLVYMVKFLSEMSNNSPINVDYSDMQAVLNDIVFAMGKGERIFFIGVSFALLDCAERCEADLSGVIVMETGGMKGRRRELTRNELHHILKKGFNVDSIHSEYGMTELLSQAYSLGDGIYRTPPWMRVVLRDTLDPLLMLNGYGRTGGINVIDLANINSCAFIATSDLGRLNIDGSFEVLGRFDNSDLRGCNLLTV